MPSTTKYVKKQKVLSTNYSATYAREWRKENPDACSVSHCHRPRLPNRSLCLYHKLIVYDQNTRKKVARKAKVLAHYSPNGVLGCSWEGCSITDIDMLSLDHINNDGAKDRRDTNGASGDSLYRKAEQAGFPETFQTLCFNHQMKKERLLRRRHTKQL